MLTNDSHHLLQRDIAFVREDTVNVYSLWQSGPVYWVHGVYAYSLFGVSLVLLFVETIWRHGIARQQAMTLFAATILLAVGSLLDTRPLWRLNTPVEIFIITNALGGRASRVGSFSVFASSKSCHLLTGRLCAAWMKALLCWTVRIGF